MYPISNAVKALFEAEQRQTLRITGTDRNNTAISITEADVKGNGFIIDRYSCNGTRLEIGTAIASELSLKLDNRDNQYGSVVFEGTELFVEMGVADWTQSNPVIDWIPCGYFTPDQQPRSLDTITLNALDRMMRFDKMVETMELPATITQLIGQACIACDVPFEQDISGFPNASYSVNEMPELQTKITYRRIIQWCAGILGANAWIDWEGKLRFSWFETTTGYTIAPENRFSSDLYEDDIEVTGVAYTGTEGTTIVAGDSDYTIDMTGNYLVAAGISEILPNINAKINGFTYRPFYATVINAPYLWPMDVVTFRDKGGTDHTSVLTNVNFNLNGVTALQGKGETAQTNAGESPSGMTDEQAFIVEKAKQSAIDDVDESLTQEDIFNRLTEHGRLQGLYMLDGQLYINASYLQAGELNAAIVRIKNLSADDIASGIIHSADYQTVVIDMIYPSSGLYPSDTTYANNGERVISGFAIDFSAGQILGGFYSEQITDLQSDVSDIQSAVSDLQSAIAALQSALVYPKAVPSGLQSFAPLNMTDRMNNGIRIDDSDQINDETSADDTVEEDE